MVAVVRLGRALAHRSGRVLAVVLALALLALLPARSVRVETDLVSLLPTGSPAADGYRVFLDRFGGLEKVFVLVVVDTAPVELDDPDPVHVASWLEEQLADHPEIASIRAGFGPDDIAFLRRWVAPRAPLLIPDEAIPTLAAQLTDEAVRDRATTLQASIHSPAWGARGLLVRGDPLGFSDALLAERSTGGLPVDPMTSTFLSSDGTVALLALTPARSELDAAGGRALQTALDRAAESARDELGDGFRVLAVGGPLYAAQDETRIRSDLTGTLSASLAGTALILIAAFEGLAVPLALLAPLLVALAWTVGAIGFLGWPISAISIGFAAVLVGLGIDYALHGGVRFRQNLVEGASPSNALTATFGQAGPAILTSATTTVAGFAVLAAAHVRPLADLGRLVPLGMSAVLIATATAGGTLLVITSARLSLPGRTWRLLGGCVELLLTLAERRPRAVVLAALALTATSLVGVTMLRLDADPRLFRPDDHPAIEAESLLAEHFGLGSDTANLVVRGDDLDQALARTRKAAAVLSEALGPQAEIDHPADLLTRGEAVERRLATLADLPFTRAAERLEVELPTVNLAPRAFRVGLDALRAFGRGEDPGPPPPDAWPDWIDESIAESADGTWVALRLRLPSGTWPEGPPQALVDRLREVAPGCTVASATALGAELRVLAGQDIRRLGLLALLAIGGMVAFSFRGSPGATLIALTPPVLGATWALGLSGLADRPLDLFGLAVLPILLGIGIDDGLHIVHGARSNSDTVRPLTASARHAGRAIVLTTATTCVGFGSLLLSDLPGLRRGGLLIAGGVAACLIATLVVLPAIEVLVERSRRDRVDARPS